MQMKRLGHVAVCVEDVAKAAEFYQSLGMRLVWQDSDWAYLKAGNDGLALMSPEYDQAGPHFGFVFSDRAEIDTAYEKLKADGVKVGKIHNHRDGTASFYGRDPFGNWFEYLYEPDDLFEGRSEDLDVAASNTEMSINPDCHATNIG
jgi:catechol 2,3-dioxygenase-like lactoylglutathione lyase family enzyme